MPGWRKYKITELDPKELNVTTKRFEKQTTLLYELIDNDKFIICEFFSIRGKPLLCPLRIVNKVITDIKYPLTATGQPTDFHYYQAFKRFWGSCRRVYKNDYDYFQFASETAWLRMGDCEDSSILTAAGLENLKVINLVDYFVCFGAVYKRDILLGYHAWIVVKTKHGWRLAETTLDTPYKNVLEMPPVNLATNSWKVGELIYKAMLIFNKKELWEWVTKSEKMERLKEFLEKTHKEKETKKKYKEMSKAYYKLMKKETKVK